MEPALFGIGGAVLQTCIRVNVSELDGVVVMTIHGEIHFASALAVQAILAEMEPNSIVVLDCAQVDFMDTTGLNLLLALRSRMREHAGLLRIRRPSKAVRRMLELTSTDSAFELIGA